MNEKVVIDNTKPEIEVVYDQNNQTQYYNFSRKATVTVKEKNFSPDLVVWNIQGSNQKYQIGEWKNVQGTYVCEISFEEDGRDYSVGLSVTDKAEISLSGKIGIILRLIRPFHRFLFR